MSRRSEKPWKRSLSGQTSFERAQEKFSGMEAADEYPAGYPESIKGSNEKIAVLRAISMFPAGGHILDCPSGTGRVMQLLLERGYEVTASDCSEYMVDQCRKNMLRINPSWEAKSHFGVEDVTQTSYPDKYFEGVICNRLLHHFSDSETRVRVLTELARVSRGPVIASFTNSFSISLQFKRLRTRMAGRTSGSRPVSTSQMKAEFQAAGLNVTTVIPVMWGFSRMWYMAGIPQAATQQRAA